MPRVLLPAPRVLLLAGATGFGLWGLISFPLIKAFVVCFGLSCLDDRIVAGGSDPASYLFDDEHCFITAEMLSSRNYSNVRYPGLTASVLDYAYMIYPDLRVFIIPTKPGAGPIVSISADQVRPKTDMEFCAENVRAERAGDTLSIKQPVTFRTTRRGV